MGLYSLASIYCVILSWWQRMSYWRYTPSSHVACTCPEDVLFPTMRMCHYDNLRHYDDLCHYDDMCHYDNLRHYDKLCHYDNMSLWRHMTTVVILTSVLLWRPVVVCDNGELSYPSDDVLLWWCFHCCDGITDTWGLLSRSPVITRLMSFTRLPAIIAANKKHCRHSSLLCI